MYQIKYQTQYKRKSLIIQQLINSTIKSNAIIHRAQVWFNYNTQSPIDNIMQIIVCVKSAMSCSKTLGTFLRIVDARAIINSSKKFTYFSTFVRFFYL